MTKLEFSLDEQISMQTAFVPKRKKKKDSFKIRREKVKTSLRMKSIACAGLQGLWNCLNRMGNSIFLL